MLKSGGCFQRKFKKRVAVRWFQHKQRRQRDGERDRERDTHRERETGRERETDRQTETVTDRETYTFSHTHQQRSAEPCLVYCTRRMRTVLVWPGPVCQPDMDKIR